MLDCVLVANRGGIARREIATARRPGIRAAAVSRRAARLRRVRERAYGTAVVTRMRA